MPGQHSFVAAEAGHSDATDLTRDFSPGNSDAMNILTLGLGLGLGLGRVLGLEIGRQYVPGLKNTGVNFLASGRSRQDVAGPSQQRWQAVGDTAPDLTGTKFQTIVTARRKASCYKIYNLQKFTIHAKL